MFGGGFVKKYFKGFFVVLMTAVLITGIVLNVGAYSVTRKAEVSVPVDVKTANLNGNVIVTWGKQSDADGFIIYRKENNVKKAIGKVTNAARNKYTDKNVKSGGKYTYSVSAYKGKRKSAESTQSRIIYLDMPRITSVTVSKGGMALTWSKVEGAQSYIVYRNKSGKFKQIAETDGNTCFLKDTDVLQGQKYGYAVAARKAGFKSAFEVEYSDVYVVTPKLKTAINGNGYVSVSWYPVFGADYYKVYRKTDSSAWKCIGTVNAVNADNTLNTSIQDKSVSNGKVYVYTVRAISGGNYSGFDGNGVCAKYVGVPKNVKVLNSKDCLRVSWSSVEDAAKYAVYRKDGKNTSWKFSGYSVGTVFEDCSVTNGNEYTYSVRAIGNNGGLSAFSGGVKTTALKAPLLVLQCTSNSIKVSWSAIAGATEYRLYRKAEGAKNWTGIYTIKSGKTTSFTDKNVVDGKKYTYTVRAVKGDILGSYSTEGYSIRFYAPPTVYAKLSPKGIAVTWSKSPAGTGYELERMTESGGKWIKIAKLNGISSVKFTDAKASYGEINYYRVKVTGAELVSSSASVFAVDPNKPAVALTFDDGPYTPVTNRILNVLEKNNARATFFVVGSRVNAYSDCIKREAALGCEIANHTYNHTILTSVSESVIKSEIQQTNDAVKKITGKSPVLVRAPGGSVNAKVKNAVDYPLIGWSVDTLDWKNSSGVVSEVKRSVKDGSIVLMHDLYGTTASAVETLVPWLVNQGYQLVTVSELMQLKGVDLQAGKVYSAAY